LSDLLPMHNFHNLGLNPGGGLISGITLAAKTINPSIRIIAAEPKGADDASQSKVAGRIVTLPETNTIADGLRAFLGDLTW
jgi:serine racemase